MGITGPSSLSGVNGKFSSSVPCVRKLWMLTPFQASILSLLI